MSLFKSTVALFYVNSLVVGVSSFTLANITEVMELPETEVMELPEPESLEAPEVVKESNIYNIIMSAILQRVNLEDFEDVKKKNRVKKDVMDTYAQASTLTPVKLFHLILLTLKHLVKEEPSKGEKRINADQVAARIAAMYKHHLLNTKGLESEWQKVHPTPATEV